MEVLLKMKGTDGAALWSEVLQGLPNPHSPFLQVIKDPVFPDSPLS